MLTANAGGLRSDTVTLKSRAPSIDIASDVGGGIVKKDYTARTADPNAFVQWNGYETSFHMRLSAGPDAGFDGEAPEPGFWVLTGLALLAITRLGRRKKAESLHFVAAQILVI
jgi:hypothetical protein